jgi:hypothetical protein
VQVEMHRTFTVSEARAMMPELLTIADEFVARRAELTEAAAAQRRGDASVAIADLKAMEARLGEMLDDLRSRGLEVKGWAPLLLDFPAEVDGRDVLLCWLEGDRELAWYHDPELGFAARRPLP